MEESKATTSRDERSGRRVRGDARVTWMRYDNFATKKSKREKQQHRYTIQQPCVRFLFTGNSRPNHVVESRAKIPKKTRRAEAWWRTAIPGHRQDKTTTKTANADEQQKTQQKGGRQNREREKMDKTNQNRYAWGWNDTNERELRSTEHDARDANSWVMKGWRRRMQNKRMRKNKGRGRRDGGNKTND